MKLAIAGSNQNDPVYFSLQLSASKSTTGADGGGARRAYIMVCL